MNVATATMRERSAPDFREVRDSSQIPSSHLLGLSLATQPVDDHRGCGEGHAGHHQEAGAGALRREE